MEPDPFICVLDFTRNGLANIFKLKKKITNSMLEIYRVASYKSVNYRLTLVEEIYSDPPNSTLNE